MTPDSTAADYVHALFHLLPRGRYWRRGDLTTRLALVIAGLGEELARLHNRGLDLLDELDPRTTADMLENWKELVGVPDPCVAEADWPASDAEWREAVHAALTSYGGQSPEYFELLADRLLGLTPGTCVVVEGSYMPFRASENRAGDRCNLYGSQFLWILQAPAATPANKRAQLECLIDRLKPAHTVAWYSYVL